MKVSLQLLTSDLYFECTEGLRLVNTQTPTLTYNDKINFL